MNSARQELDALLSFDVDEIRSAERQEFDRLSEGKEIVLMGAGGLGRRTLTGLRQNQVEPLAFADNATHLHGQVVDGVPVLSPEVAAQRFGARAVFVVTIWGANRPHRFAHSRTQLHRSGANLVCSFPPLFWKYAESLLPFYLHDLPSRGVEHRDQVQQAFELWEDDRSRAEYVDQVRLRLNADFDGLPQPVADRQYFPTNLFSWSENEWLVDGGAYDGDSIRSVIDLHGHEFSHVLAIEPDALNFRELESTIASLPFELRCKIRCVKAALGERPGTLYLTATGTAASAIAFEEINGSVAVDVETIDSLVDGAVPTFIKLDIEGFERAALRGARRVIEQHAPVLAICVYHKQNDLWEIPLMLHEWQKNYAFFLRPHNEEGWDLVCYAVPRTRLWSER